jgi:hypothetical protein
LGFVNKRVADKTSYTKTVKAEAFYKEYKESNTVRLKLKTFKSNNNILNLIT